MLKLSIFTAGFIFILASVTTAVYAKNIIYPLPPPNDTSLYFGSRYPSHSPVQHKRHHAVSLRHKAHHFTASHPKRHSTLASRARRHSKPLCRHKAQGSSGLYVYYALPAPACCGVSWELHKANCCAHSGEWQTSYYATFNPHPVDDFIYSATNDDDTRSYDAYRKLVANGELDDSEDF